MLVEVAGAGRADPVRAQQPFEALDALGLGRLRLGLHPNQCLV